MSRPTLYYLIVTCYVSFDNGTILDKSGRDTFCEFVELSHPDLDSDVTLPGTGGGWTIIND
jgi:hypothetical protein